MENNQNSLHTNVNSNLSSQSPSQNIYYWGYGLLAISFGFYLFFELLGFGDQENLKFMIFMIHYFIAIAYLFTLIMNNSFGFIKSWTSDNIDKTIILLNIYLVSCYALNRVLPVFEISANWFYFYLIFCSVALLSFRFHEVLPKWINYIQYFFVGSCLVLYAYLAIYVAVFYLVGSIGIILFGIGIHIFIPLALLTASIVLVLKSIKKNIIIVYWGLSGFIFTISIVITFVVVWNTRVSKIESIANQSVIFSQNDLPVWVKVAQVIKNDWISQRILKSDLVYTMSEDKFSDWDFMPNTANWEEKRKHDPLVFIASIFSKCSLSDSNRVKILQSITDAKYKSNERLWSGDNLLTSYVVTDIDIYPQLRIAYTEKYINIKNDSKDRWWGNTQEAIYTFQLPEGSVVTSLSLWINGKEEKGILTSKQKATNAYKTIVGVEQRDPSVVHWQEGNTITVRVFPCTNKEERKFKIGFTSPMAFEDKKIVYKNITFRGPSANSAKETTRFRVIESKNKFEIPEGFKRDKKGDFISEGNYNPNFELRFDETAIKLNIFSFNGYKYAIQEFKPTFQSIDIESIYLDLNNSWNTTELEELKELLKSKKICVYVDDEFIQLDESNWSVMTSDLRLNNFSLFPFHLIKEINHSLVITKGKEFSPHLSDIKESIFASKIGSYFAKGHKIKVFNISNQNSTYISSIREFRGFEYENGDIDKLKNLLFKGVFPQNNESEIAINIYSSGIQITKSKSDSISKDNAPDHLARLFEYNDIMRKVGSNYFKADFINEELVDQAASAYVVSPVSSLIVLESKEDYKRFGIKDKDNSLKNASKDNSGAVPEPHEWALIILFLLLVVYTVRNSKFRLSI